MHAPRLSIPALADLLRLAAPLVVGQFALIGIGVSDVIIAGHAGTVDLAAVTLGFYLWDLAMLPVFGIMLANGALVAHRCGAGDDAGVRTQFRQALWLALPLALLGALAMALARALVAHLDVPVDVAQVARGYLLPTIGTAALVPLMVCFRTTAEGLGRSRPVMWLGLAAFALNIPLNIALVHGRFGLPRLGGAGCGWASLASMLLLTIAWAVHLQRGARLRSYGFWGGSVPPSPAALRALLALGLPIGLELLGVAGFFAVLPLLVARLGTLPLAGHSVAITLDLLMVTVPLGIGQAMSVRVAQALGAGDGRAAHAVCRDGGVLLLAIATLQMTFIVLLREPLARLFSSDPAVCALASTLLLFAALYRLFDSAQIGACLTLRGYRDTRAASLITIGAYWLLGLPLCAALAFGTTWNRSHGVQGVWTGMVVTIIIAATLVCGRLAHVSARYSRTLPAHPDSPRP